MFAKVTYLGFYPLGSDFTYNGVKIMQTNWIEYKHFVVPIWEKTVNPFFSEVYYVINVDNTVFFAATEHGLGHYHIFQ